MLTTKERVTMACNTSIITNHASKGYTSHVTRHASHVTRHTSHITRHTSHVTRHLVCISRSLGEKGACDPGMCVTCHIQLSHVTLHVTYRWLGNIEHQHVKSHESWSRHYKSNTTRHTRHASRIACHTSHITRHTSHVTRHTSRNLARLSPN